MESVLESSAHLERELAREPFAGPAAGSVGLHLTIFGMLICYGWAMGLFHHNFWGTSGAGGSMQVTLTNALPLPADQINQNVLATETPSNAPAAPSPKEQKHVDETAIPILGKPTKPTTKNIPKTQLHQPPPKQNVAQYGEQSGSVMPHQMQQSPGTGQAVNVTNGDFGSMYPWYVQVIKTKVGQNWDSRQVDSRTPKEAAAQIYFRLNADGAPSNFKVNRSSGSPTLDQSCLAATERVDTFGRLPSLPRITWLDVTYDCTYLGEIAR
jgi:periplasmic protein TonB